MPETATPVEQKSRSHNLHKIPERLGRRLGMSSTSPEKPGQNGHTAPEKNQENGKYSEQRQKLRSHLEQQGDILPDSHAFTQLVQRVSKRLGVPKDTEFIVVDTEEVNAFFHPTSRTIALTRGFEKYFIRQGLELREEHIAAVLAHELEHAEVLGQDYTRKIESSYKERLKAFQNHAEEYRADAEAMSRLSKAGYNPRAMTELLRAMSLTTGRHDLGHPEVIDRIRKLESRLADDEHPLSHTTKETTALDPKLIDWFKEDSEVYNNTENLIHASPQELRQQLLQARTQKEFWTAYEALQHIERIGVAKDLLISDKSIIDRLSQKIMILEALGSRQLIPKRKGEETNINSVYNDEKEKKDSEGNYLLSYKITHPFGTDGAQKALAAQKFRQEVPANSSFHEAKDQAKERLEDQELKVDRVITSIFNRLSQAQLSEAQQDTISQLKEQYENGTISSEIFSTVFSSFDKEVQQKQHAEHLQSSRERGVRAGEERTHNLFDFSQDEVRQQFLDQIELSLALAAIEDMPEPEPSTIDKLASVIGNDTHLPPEGAKIIAETILFGKEADDWAEYLKTLDKPDLIPVIKSTQDVIEKGRTLFSPQRSLHSSYVSSLSEVEWRKRYAPVGNFAIDASGLGLMKMLPGNELYKRGWPEDFPQAGGGRPQPEEINLTFEEWDAVVDSKGDHGAWTAIQYLTLKKYIRGIKSGEQIDDDLLKRAKNVRYEYVAQNFNAEEIGVLIEHPVWDTEKLGKNIEKGIKELPHQSDDPYERQEILRTLKLAYDLYSEHPLKVRDEFWDRDLSTPETVSSHMMDILVQDLEKSGKTKNDALVEAIRYLTKENVSFKYELLSNEVKNAAGILTDKNLENLISFFQKKEKLDENQQVLMENFKILSEMPDEKRKEVGPQIVSETSLKTLIENHGDNTVAWVLENIHPSPTRDVMLVGLIDFASADLRDKFIDETRPNLVASPDVFQGHDSPFFSLSLWHTYVDKEDKNNNKRFFRGTGKLAETYDDLLTRRFAFSTLDRGSDKYLERDNWYNVRHQHYFATPYQGFQAELLTQAEDALFDTSIPIEERVGRLQEIAPRTSVVRDVHIELLLREELQELKDPQEKVKVGNMLLSLFSEKSRLRDNMAAQVWQAELESKPELIKNYDKYLEVLTRYLPEPSPTRNYYLTKLEDSVSLTFDQLRHLTKLRMSSEGKKQEDDDAPMTFVMNKLGELNREERVVTALWLMGLSDKKPKTVTTIEKSWDGHLNNLPKMVMASTPDQQEIIFKRLFLGAEGILDLEISGASQSDNGIRMDLDVVGEDEEVKPKESEAPVKAETPEESRRKFVDRLAEEFLPEDMPNATLFRKMFTTIVESSEPAHAAQIVTRLIQKSAEAHKEGKELPPEEVVALGLTEMGVVGKKVAQSLAEMEWVPESYKNTLKKAQEEGTIVPKRALLRLAEDAGLLDENSPIRIISFDSHLGAASNKQGCLVTVEVTDESVGLPKGRHQIVGKFKRPSAQKTENLDHDLKVLEKILSVAQEEGYGDKLPQDFSLNISDAVKRELDFRREQKFNEVLKEDLQSRNVYRMFPVETPTIFFASDDVMLEAQAKGISLRDYLDLQEENPDALQKIGFKNFSTSAINQKVLGEAIAEIVVTGNMHADLHPGNIFVAQDGTITFIDTGMHEQLSREQRINTMSLLTGLTLGNERYVKNILERFGWDTSEVDINLSRRDFANNTLELLRASQKAKTAPPELIGSIIIATSKLSTYAEGVNVKELFKFLRKTMNKKDIFALLGDVRNTEGKRGFGDIWNLLYSS